jgi:hypothetical protein
VDHLGREDGEGAGSDGHKCMSAQAGGTRPQFSLEADNRPENQRSDEPRPDDGRGQKGGLGYVGDDAIHSPLKFSIASIVPLGRGNIRDIADFQQIAIASWRSTMPAKSKAQQKAAGAALSAKRGDTKKSDLKGASKDMVESMTEKELEELAETKRKKLPNKKKG